VNDASNEFYRSRRYKPAEPSQDPAVPMDADDERRKRKRRPERANDQRPLITIAAGDIERIVNEVEAALIASDRGLYQRGAKIVAAERVPAIAAGDKKITVTSICERGDLALREDASVAAAFQKFDSRVNAMVTTDAPMAIIQTLQQRGGRLRFPVLAGVIHAPAMRADGSLLTVPGYDKQTGLLFDPLSVTFPPIPDRPIRDDAVKALDRLEHLIKDFPFVTPAHRAVALSAILTAPIRRSLSTAPFHAFSAPIRGSGKSKLVDIASVIATGEVAPVLSAGGDDVELEKRLVASLLAGSPIITIDNCSRPIGGDLLCQMLTQTMVRPRILGKSETPTCPTGAFIAGTGQNFAVEGDMARRTIVCKIDPKMEIPETREFPFEPVSLAKGLRPQLVVAVLTILRAHHVAGLPGNPPAKSPCSGRRNLATANLSGMGFAAGLSFAVGEGRLRVSTPDFYISKTPAPTPISTGANRRQFQKWRTADTERIEIPRENKKRTCA
jgi:putative DNA primase/helicase